MYQQTSRKCNPVPCSRMWVGQAKGEANVLRKILRSHRTVLPTSERQQNSMEDLPPVSLDYCPIDRDGISALQARIDLFNKIHVLFGTALSGQFPEDQPDKEPKEQPTREANRKDLFLRHRFRWDGNAVLGHMSLRCVKDGFDRSTAGDVCADGTLPLTNPTNSASCSCTAQSFSPGLLLVDPMLKRARSQAGQSFLVPDRQGCPLRRPRRRLCAHHSEKSEMLLSGRCQR